MRSADVTSPSARQATPTTPPRSDLVHPLMLASIAALALNDHVFKGSGWLPGWLTGKLSDFAGLLFFPTLLVVVAEGWLGRRGRGSRRRLTSAVAVALTGAAFTALKVSPALAAVASRVMGPVVCDPWDLIALPSLLLAYRHLTRHLPERPAPRWAQATAVVLAGAASMATSRPPVSHGYANWQVASSSGRELGCAFAEVWISKSGKQGAGATIRLDSDDPGCVVTLTAARIVLPGREIATSLPLPRALAAGRPTEPPPPPSNDPSAPPPDRGAYFYVPFAFDSEGSWNSGERTALLELSLSHGGREERWSIPLEYEYDGYHVSDLAVKGPFPPQRGSTRRLPPRGAPVLEVPAPGAAGGAR
jgi:hypothetical protein